MVPKSIPAWLPRSNIQRKQGQAEDAIIITQRLECEEIWQLLYQSLLVNRDASLHSDLRFHINNCGRRRNIVKRDGSACGELDDNMPTNRRPTAWTTALSLALALALALVAKVTAHCGDNKWRLAGSLKHNCTSANMVSILCILFKPGDF